MSDYSILRVFANVAPKDIHTLAIGPDTHKEINAILAERDRLREALREIGRGTAFDGGGEAHQLRLLARQALADTEGS